MNDFFGIAVVFLALVGVYAMLFRGVLKERSGEQSFLARRYSDTSLLESNLFTFLSGITTSAAVLTIFSTFGWTPMSTLAAAALGAFYAFVFRSDVLSSINTRVRAALEGLVGIIAIVPAFIQFSANSLSCRDPQEQVIAVVVMVALGLVALASIGLNLRFGLNRTGNGPALSGFRGFLAAYAGLEILRFFWTPLGLSWSEIGLSAGWVGIAGGITTIIGLVVVPQLVTALGGLALFASLLLVESTAGSRCGTASSDGIAVLVVFVISYALARFILNRRWMYSRSR